MRLDSRARTSARRRRGISKGFPTLATNAITAHHAVDEILESGCGSASSPSHHVRFALPTPPGLCRLACCGSAKRKVVVLHIGSDRNKSGAAAWSEGGCPQVVNECHTGRPSHAAITSKAGRGGPTHLSDQAPADIGENKDANDNQRDRDNAAQRG